MAASFTSCTDWTYDNHPQRPTTLSKRCALLQRAIAKVPHRYVKFGLDTRIGHKFLFRDFVPTSCKCIAGNPRGESTCSAIAHSHVGIQSDEKVGVHPQLVAVAMHVFNSSNGQAFNNYLVWAAANATSTARPVMLVKLVDILADILQEFLTIHPYKDGNGHTARLLVYTLMVRAGFVPTNWNIDSKQPYHDALHRHRRGDKTALQRFLISLLALPQQNATPMAAPTADLAAGPS